MPISLLCLLFAASTGLHGQTTSITAVNAATYEQGVAVAPGSLVVLFGTFTGVSVAAADAALPVRLGNAEVTVNGTPAPLLYTSPQQINLILPENTAEGFAEIRVRAAGAELGAATLPVTPASPLLFLTAAGRERPGLFLMTNGNTNSMTNRLEPGDTFTLYATGLPAGTTSQRVSAMVGLTRLDATRVEPITGRGLWLVQFQLPATFSGSGQTPFAISSGGAASNTVSVWLR